VPRPGGVLSSGPSLGPHGCRAAPDLQPPTGRDAGRFRPPASRRALWRGCASRGSSSGGCSGRRRRRRDRRGCSWQDLCPWGSTGAAARWCSRWWRAATGLRIAEVDLQVGVDPQLRVLGRLGALVSGQRPAQWSGSAVIASAIASRTAAAAWTGHRRAVVDLGTIAAVHRRKVKQHRRAAAALHEGADRRAAQPRGSSSLSQCPETVLSCASAGRWLIMTSSLTKFLPRPRTRALGTRSARPVRRHAVNSRRSAPWPCTHSDW
jgi:hypothetical protein